MSGRVGHGEDEPHLTAREIEVLAMLAQGYSPDKIARQLFISAVTVKQHLENIRRKGFFGP